VNAVHSKMPVEQGFMQSRDAKSVPKACKIGLSLPNLTLPVNKTVKKGRIDLENLKLFAQSMDSATKPDTSIGYQKKDRNRMGSEDLVDRQIELFQRSVTETLTVMSGGKLGEIKDKE
jgi:hypothetical protein